MDGGVTAADRDRRKTLSSAQRLVLAHDLASYPGISRFALDFVRHEGTARTFLDPADDVTESPAHVASRDAIARELIETNSAWGNDVRREVEQWRSGAMTLIAGQQIGFGGGPLYTLTKIASLINLRERYRREGRDAVVFFWMATEDHDFLEVAQLTLPVSSGTKVIRAAERPESGRVVGNLPLPVSLVEQFRRIEPSLVGPWCDTALSFRDSFALLLASVLRDRGVVLVDALLPSVRRAGSDVFEQIAGRWAEAQTLVRLRDRELLQAGYSPQVQGESDHAFLWMIGEQGQRTPVRRGADGSFSTGDEAVSLDHLLATIEHEPARISTGALLRPVLQDLAFGTDVFVGGPAEVSYYAQSAVLHEMMGVRAPKIMLRGHVLVSPRRALERMLRHGMRIEEIYDPPDSVLARREGDATLKWSHAITSAAAQLSNAVSEAAPLAAGAAPEMNDSIRRSMRRIDYHMDRMRERGARAIARRDRERAEAVERVHSILAPGEVPQDRHVSWLPWYHRWKGDLLDALADCAEPDSVSVSVLGMEG